MVVAAVLKYGRSADMPRVMVASAALAVSAPAKGRNEKVRVPARQSAAQAARRAPGRDAETSAKSRAWGAKPWVWGWGATNGNSFIEACFREGAETVALDAALKKEPLVPVGSAAMTPKVFQ